MLLSELHIGISVAFGHLKLLVVAYQGRAPGRCAEAGSMGRWDGVSSQCTVCERSLGHDFRLGPHKSL